MSRAGWTKLLAVLLCGVGAQQAHAFNEYQLLKAKDLPASCAPNAKAQIKLMVRPFGGYTDQLKIQVNRVAPGTKMTLFLTQVPNPPYGVTLYIGDVVANDVGSVARYFYNRFDHTSFVVAPGVANAPRPHGVADAASNPAFGPIHTYHVGLWFASAADAAKNGASCPKGPTPYNATHNAGGQLFSSRNATNTNNLTGFLSFCPGPRYCPP